MREVGDGRLGQGEDGDPHVVGVVLHTLALVPTIVLQTLSHWSHGLQLASSVFEGFRAMDEAVTTIRTEDSLMEDDFAILRSHPSRKSPSNSPKLVIQSMGSPAYVAMVVTRL